MYYMANPASKNMTEYLRLLNLKHFISMIKMLDSIAHVYLKNIGETQILVNMAALTISSMLTNAHNKQIQRTNE